MVRVRGRVREAGAHARLREEEVRQHLEHARVAPVGGHGPRQRVHVHLDEPPPPRVLRRVLVHLVRVRVGVRVRIRVRVRARVGSRVLVMVRVGVRVSVRSRGEG